MNTTPTQSATVYRNMLVAWSTLSSNLAQLTPSAHQHMLQQHRIRIGTLLPNLSLNRYNNIIPFDHTLCHIKSRTYVNANHIQLPRVQGPLIIAQCPMHPSYYGPDTTSAFWQLVQEHHVSTIVNLAQIESGYSGASLYWPVNEGDVYESNHAQSDQSESVEGYTIQCIQVEVLVAECLTRRRIQVLNKENNVVSIVSHYHFEQWPNYDIASSSTHTKTLLKHVLQERIAEEEHQRPTLVHCSGGVGRSGTFVAALAAVEQIQREAPPSPPSSPSPSSVSLSERLLSLVSLMREQRHPWMVEGEAQFLFAGRLVMEMMAAEGGGEEEEGEGEERSTLL
jgi:protein tyrosine phosphatase